MEDRDSVKAVGTPNEFEKAREIVQKARHVLIALPLSASVDKLAASEYLLMRLKRLGKEVLLSPIGSFPKHLSGHFSEIQKPSGALVNLTLTLDTERYPVSELRYEKENGELVVYISPKDRAIPPDAVRIREAPIKADAIITIGLSSLADLGDFYEKNPRLFFETPIVALGINAAHDRHGEANVIDVRKSALTEVSHELVRAISPGPLAKTEATLILLGISASKKKEHSPETVELIRACLDAGADATKASRAYQNASLQEVQLAGRAAARTKEAPIGIVSVLTAADFLITRTGPEAIETILDSLIAISGHETAVLFWQHPLTQRVGFAIQTGLLDMKQRVGNTFDGQWKNLSFFGNETFATFESAENAVLFKLPPPAR